MKKATLGGNWGVIAAFKIFIGLQVGRKFLWCYMTGNSKSSCTAPAWLQSPRSSSHTGMQSGFFLPGFWHAWAISTERFIFCHSAEAKQHGSLGIFQAPLGTAAHNYFYKNLLQLLHSLPTSPFTPSPLLLHDCWNLDTAKAPAVSAIAVYRPTHGNSSANSIVQRRARTVFGQHPACGDPALCKHSWAQRQQKHIDKIALEIGMRVCHKPS